MSALPVLLPILAAVLIVALERVLGRRVVDLLAITIAAATALLFALEAEQARDGILVEWFGGWRPQHGAAIGVAFTVDAAGALLGCFAALLTTFSLLYSCRYFEAVGTRFHALMLLLLGAIAGFVSSGDLFNLFVFFELMGVAALALTGYQIEERGPSLGALNFAVTHCVAASLVLLGIALVYGRTGALNLAQLGRSMAALQSGPIPATAFTLIASGFLVKAAVAPFHFWLPDAQTVAPAPVSVLLSGVMVELGLYAVARIHWTVFAGALGQAGGTMQATLRGLGLLTALLGGTAALFQRHLKRLLAFSTVSHSGLMLCGIAALRPEALAGGAIYLIGHGLLMASAFMTAGLVLHRFGTADLDVLKGRSRVLAAALAIVALGLAGLPPFPTAIGGELIAHAVGAGAILMVVPVLTAAAVFRAAARIGFGSGETPGGPAIAPLMLFPALAMLALALAFGVLTSDLEPSVLRGALRFVDHASYATIVLAENAPLRSVVRAARAPALSAPLHHPWIGVLAALLALGLAWLARRTHHWPLARALARGLERLHNGRLGDYVIWLIAGVSLLSLAVWWS